MAQRGPASRTMIGVIGCSPNKSEVSTPLEI
jgi:hypothetical protein